MLVGAKNAFIRVMEALDREWGSAVREGLSFE